MFLDPGGYGKNVRIEDHVRFIETDVFREYFMRALRNTDLVLDRGCLFLFVERHHNDRGTVTPNELGTPPELFLAFLQRNRINDSFSLHAPESRFNDVEVR